MPQPQICPDGAEKNVNALFEVVIENLYIQTSF